MQFGVAMFPADYAMSVVDLARAAEEHGFESLFLPEHTHIPTSRRSPWPQGGDLPREYSHTLDPFVLLGAAAAVTSRLRIGTSICLVAQREPIVLAKEVSSLDRLSGGRFLFGIGAGWNREEMENHGTDPAQRWKIMRERVLAMKQIWTQDEAEFHGRFVSFDALWQWPKPVQGPHPPILVGGNGPRVLQRVVEYGDEWFPSASRRMEDLPERIAELNRLAAAAGRGPMPVSFLGARPDPKMIEQLARIGVRRCVFWLPPASADDVLPILAQHAAVAKSFA